jgi:serine/threonine protein kinase
LSLLEKYSHQTFIGNGAFGKIYKALRLSDKVEVCIKKISMTQTRSITNTVENEMELLRQLNHKHVVKYYDHFKSEGVFCSVMKFVNGKDLRKLINRKRNRMKNLNIHSFESYFLRCFQHLNIAKN